MTTREFQQRSGLRIFLSYFRPHRKLFLLDMACALCISLIDLAFPYVSRWCMYELLPQDAYRTFSHNVLDWARDPEQRRQLITAIYIYVYQKRGRE